jgi:ABC-2 type transport system permease protein
MLRDTTTKWLWDNRRSIIGWTIALSAVAVFYGSMWPAFNDPAILETFEDYPKALMEALNYTNIVTAPGYINATVYGLILANLTVVYGVMTGTRIIAGDEEAGTLDLVLAHPLGRKLAALQRYTAYLLSYAVMCVGLFVVVSVMTGPAQLEGISVADVGAMQLHLLFFGGFIGALAFALGAATGRKALTVSVCVGLAVFGFAANGVLAQVNGLEWIKDWSPYNWLNGGLPLENGVQLGDIALMASLTIVLVAAGVFLFDRRDINV